jgi:hypothetical protein
MTQPATSAYRDALDLIESAYLLMLGPSDDPYDGNTAHRTGVLRRDTDTTGVSGEGDVADVWAWNDRATGEPDLLVVRWRGQFSSAVVWPSLDSLLAVHGHDGLTRLVWNDQPDNPKEPTP